MARVVIDLPDALAEQARREGLLTEQAVHQLIEEATRIAAFKRLKGIWSAVPEQLQGQPAMAPEALQEVIREVRRARLG